MPSPSGNPELVGRREHPSIVLNQASNNAGIKMFHDDSDRHLKKREIEGEMLLMIRF